MRQHVDANGSAFAAQSFGYKRDAVLPDRPIDRDIGIGDLAGPRHGRGKSAVFRYLGQRSLHLGKRPAQVDRGRAGRSQL
jgi:hypothetical protein